MFEFDGGPHQNNEGLKGYNERMEKKGKAKEEESPKKLSR
jgi:hypothetical protein